MQKHNQKAFYSTIFEYDGATYFDQFSHVGRVDSEFVGKWINRIVKEGHLPDPLDNSCLKEEAIDPENIPVEMNNLKNVWSIALSLKNGVGYLNIVKTDEF